MTEDPYLNNIIYIKIISILSFSLICISSLILNGLVPAAGYELSIFSCIPFLVWISLSIANLCGIVVIIYGCNSIYKPNSWILGFFILLSINAIVLSLPVLRGYYLYALADPLAHLEFARSIISKGSIDSNIYPVLHILIANICIICDAMPVAVMKYLQIILSLLSMLSIYLLAKITLLDKKQSLIAVASSQPLFLTYYHLTPYPHGCSLLLFPLAIYLYFRSFNNPTPSNKILLVIFLILFPFIHPSIEVILISCLICGEITKCIWGFRANLFHPFRFSWTTILLTLIPFSFWIFYFTNLGNSIRNIVLWATGETVTVVRANELKPIFVLSVSDLLLMILKMYGHILIFLLLALLGSSIVFRKFFTERCGNINLMMISAMFFTSEIVYLILSLSVGLLTWGRFLGANACVWAMPILASISLSKLLSIAPKNKRIRHLGMIIIIFFIFASMAISISGTYRSPWISQPNWQVMQTDIAGKTWFESYSSNGLYCAQMGWIFSGFRSFSMPEHFGYNNHDKIKAILLGETYIVISERFKQAAFGIKGWINTPPEIAKPGFNETDFIMLKRDESVNKLYSNNEFEVFFARANSSQLGVQKL